MGLGLHGGGVASVKWLIKHGAQVTVTDLKSKTELKSSLDQLRGLKIKYILGKHLASDFQSTDIVIQNPGVPKESKYLKIAKKSGSLIENDASLFLKLCPGKVIGVTGTRGKSTTATLIYEILNSKFLIQNSKVWLAGLPQQPMLAILDRIKRNDTVVLELSSWQLEILGEQKINPQISMVTNIFPDHLNRYPAMQDYIEAKKKIYQFQNKDDFSIFNLDNQATKKMGSQALSKTFWFSRKFFSKHNGSFIKSKSIWFRLEGKIVKQLNLKDIKLLGQHNLENILAALAIAGLYNLPANIIKKVIANFSGLPGRMELVNKANGVEYINDTSSTIPDATIAALSQLKGKTTILLAGGSDKNIPAKKYNELSKLIKRKCKVVILFSGEGSDKLEKELKSLKFKHLVTKVPKMTEATILARTYSQTGDTVLLSPACASFSTFDNEFDRGDQFNKAVGQFR